MVVRFLLPPSMGNVTATSKAGLLSDSLSRRLGQAIHVDVAETYEALENALLGGGAELVWAPPGICAKAEEQSHGILSLVRGGDTYCSAIVRRADRASVLTPESWSGARAAWVDRRSTGGFLLAAAYLRSEGLSVADVGEQYFLGSYRAALFAVLRGMADIAAVYSKTPDEDGAKASLFEYLGTEADRLTPDAFTGASPCDGLVLASSLSAELARELQTELLSIGDGQRHSLLMEVLGADSLELSTPGHYAPLLNLSDNA